MKNIILTVILAFNGTFLFTVKAQTNTSIKCNAGKFEIGADIHNLFYALEAGRNIKDTLMLTEIPLTVKTCHCSDTVALFLTQDLFSANLIVFRYSNNEKWKFSHIQALPIELPHGSLSKEGTYTTSSYDLESDHFIIIKKTEQKPDGSNKNTEEIKYRIDIENKALLIEKVTKY